MIVFYAALANIRRRGELNYAIIGAYIVDTFVLARDVALHARSINAHSRRILEPGASDLVVRARPGVSGRLKHCIPIGEYRDRAYRVRGDLLQEWGGLSVKDGYLQRSARLPRFNDAMRFRYWFEQQRPILKEANN